MLLKMTKMVVSKHQLKLQLLQIKNTLLLIYIIARLKRTGKTKFSPAVRQPIKLLRTSI